MSKMDLSEVEMWRETIPWKVRLNLVLNDAFKFLNELRAKEDNKLWDCTKYYWDYLAEVTCIASQVLEE